MLNFIDDNDFLLVDSFTESGDGVVNWIYDEGEGKPKHSGAIFEGLTRMDEEGNSVNIWQKLLDKESTQTINIVRKTPEDIELESQMQLIRDFKISRQDQLDNSIVTTSLGNKYDADEISQGRMSRAIDAAIDSGMNETDIIQWSLADTGTGVMTDVPLSDLREARKLAVQNMQVIWGIV